ncbi:MAG: hypothetical protein WCD11_35095 [Solirubrobacteraceae bacterium]
MPFIVIVMVGPRREEYERAVGPFATEQKALDWCEAEGLGINPPFAAGQQLGVVVPFDPR